MLVFFSFAEWVLVCVAGVPLDSVSEAEGVDDPYAPEDGSRGSSTAGPGLLMELKSVCCAARVTGRRRTRATISFFIVCNPANFLLLYPQATVNGVLQAHKELRRAGFRLRIAPS